MEKERFKFNLIQKFRQNKYQKLIEVKGNDIRKFRQVFSKIREVATTFGKSYFKMEMDATELNLLNRELNGK